MNRYTFVVQVHPDGISTLENLATRERVQILDLATVGLQIVRWLDGGATTTETQEPDATRPAGKESNGAS